ncbi:MULTISPECIES: DUF3298 and DUF4163 domain-containing protein [Bacillus]|uniref:DUF3298 and DUF4163 domain-containing protein n=1 Tax=Bacillus TaxID=1386 RepID=UPI00030CCAC8|nr:MULTISPECIES: DUF3298 and DUF4163 domain-containing protein [Bacillus]
MNAMRKLINDYNNTEIPEELNILVKQTLSKKKKGKARNIWIAVAAAVILFITTVNTSSTVAYAFEDVPVLGKIVKLITFREYKVDDGTYNANIKVPAIENLDNKELEASLNEKYLAENEKLYEQFTADMEELKKNGGGHLGVESGYEIKTDNKQILSIARYNVNIVGSSSTTMKFDTIDKKNEVLITLPSLFKNNDYISIISENIKEQMRAQMKKNSQKVYWVTGTGDELFTEPFEKISKDQNFYINKQGKLVISFDKYEVAPGYMGVVEFVIPTKVIQKQLVSNEYIK